MPQAEAAYQQILQTEPDNPDALHLLGVIAHQVGKNGIAVDLINRAISSSPANPAYYSNLGAALKDQGKLDEAIACYRKALSLKPDYADAHSNLGLAFKEQGKLEKAVACFRKALSFKPDHAEAHNNLGLTHNEQGRFDAAVACYRKALSFKPDFVEAHNNLGTVLKSQGKLDEAIACYRRALSFKPDFAEAHNNVGVVLKEQGRFDEAIACYRKALAFKPDFAEAHSNRGTALLEQGELDEAIACYHKAISFKPNLAEAHYNLHALLLNPEDMGPAVRQMKRAVEISPSNSNFRFFLGMLLDYSGDAEAAASHFDQVAKGTGLDRSRLDAWKHIRSSNSKLPPIAGSNIQSFKIGLDAATNEGLIMEFGVWFGNSIRQIASLTDQEVHGFDSFAGLPEVGYHEPHSGCDTAIPSVPENVILHAGWFEDTLPGFVEKHRAPVRFMNIDCDSYDATKTVLGFFAKQIIPGTVIVFDEYIGNEHWREVEYKAFQEAVVEHGWTYEYLCFSFFTKQVVIRILKGLA